MFDRRFLRTRLGQATVASTAAMAAFVLLSSQIAMTAPLAQVAITHTAVMA